MFFKLNITLECLSGVHALVSLYFIHNIVFEVASKY